MPLCRTISQYLMMGLLACGTLASQAQSPGRQSASNSTPNQTPTGSAPAPGSQKPGKQQTHGIHVSPSLTLGRSARHSRPMMAGPPAPYKIAPSPPRVSYVDGKLTVVANNSTLADVLAAIQNATGAKIDGVTPTNTDRVFGQFGPAPAPEVCGTLLTGSGYDFIIMGSPEKSGSIQQIILTARSTETTSPSPSQTAVAPDTSSEQPPAGDSNDNQDMADTNDAMDANAPEQAPAPEQGQAQQQPSQEELQGQPSTQAQATQGQSSAPPTHPQHWGALYPPPPQTQPQQTPSQPR
jgi:hypothetical protein